MILHWGGYVHRNSECKVAIRRTALYGATGVPYGYTETWQINGRLQPTTQTFAGVTAAIAALERAYAIDGQDILLYDSAGTTLSRHFMRQSACMGKIRVVSPPSFPIGEGAEYSTYRNYEITVEADFPASGQVVIDWKETLQFTGDGGPMTIHLVPLRGAPQKQQVSQRSLFTATQSGSAVFLRKTPFPAPPLWVAALIRPQGIQVSPGTPRFRGGSAWEYPISWSYSFESATPLVGSPTFPP